MFILSKERTALLIIDMQDKVFPAVDHGNDVLQTILRLVEGCRILNIPIYASEQYPKGLGSTVFPVKVALGLDYKPFCKTTFSCADDPAFRLFVQECPKTQWILVGIEAHICVLQTAKGLLNLGKEVTVLNDAISSRSIYDFSTGIAEMRDMGVRISCSETILFELLQDSQSPGFKEMSRLIRSRCSC